MASKSSGSIAKPGLNETQSLDHYTNILRTLGINCRTLGITPASRTRRCIGDLFLDVAPPTPVRSRQPARQEILRQALQDAALLRKLGATRFALLAEDAQLGLFDQIPPAPGMTS